jgi:hypothetical protein
MALIMALDLTSSLTTVPLFLLLLYLIKWSQNLIKFEIKNPRFYNSKEYQIAIAFIH